MDKTHDTLSVSYTTHGGVLFYAWATQAMGSAAPSIDGIEGRGRIVSRQLVFRVWCAHR